MADRLPGQRTEGTLSAALGWFSIGLGLVQVAAPGRLARIIGVADRPDTRWLMRAIGLRELAGGAGILTRRRPAGWLFTRTGGDAMDLVFLGQALASGSKRRGRTIGAIAAVAGVTVLDLVSSQKLSRAAR